MGRISCTVDFDSNQAIEKKIKEMFSPENLISCFSDKNFVMYKKILSHQNIQLVLNDTSLMKTIDAFFHNNLNTTSTSSKTFMHRNTLNYRLEKIKKYTGLNLKNFEDAVVFKNLLVVNEIVNKV